MTASDTRRNALESIARNTCSATPPGFLRHLGLAVVLASTLACLPAQAGGPVSFAIDATVPTAPGAPTTTATLPLTVVPEVGSVGTVRQTSRGLFAATLLAIVAQGFGQSISNGFSQGITGTITRWFEGSSEPSAADKAKPAAVAAPVQSPAAGSGELYAGVAYEVVLVGPDGRARAVSAGSHEFRTGDRIMVFYRPTMPGRIEVFNINPAGVESRIDAQDSAGGELARLGPFQFVGDKGDETLRIVTTPCQNPKLLESTRALIKVGQQAEQAVGQTTLGDSAGALTLPPCAGVENSRQRGGRRDIQKVVLEGSVSYALDRVEPAELAAGAVASRSVAIRLLHR